MAIKVSGTTVVGNSRSLQNIASTDATTTNTIKNAIGLTFTPVQQGGGAGQLSNKVYIGWSGSELKAQVDTFDQGAIAFKSDIPAGYSDAQARAAQAGHSVGGIGSYVLGAAEVTLAAGATVAGSSVRPAGAYRDSEGNRYTTIVGSVLSGTWRCMGVNTTSGTRPLTLYLRIS